MRLFQDLPSHALFESLPYENGSAGNGPLTQARLLASLDQEDLIVPKDNGSDSDDWLVRVFSFHFKVGALTLSPLEGRGLRAGENLGRDELVLRMFDREDRTVGVVHHFFGYASDEYMG